MTPPPSTTADLSTVPDFGNDLQRIKWFGWVALGAIVLSWAGWVSLRSIATHVIEERQESHYQQLREDISELKSLIQRRQTPMLTKNPAQ